MELQLRNIGMIKEADIILDKLTLIAGENDTGKSTVGKALYSVVTGLNNAENNYNKLVLEEIDIFNLIKLISNYFIDEIENPKNDIIKNEIEKRLISFNKFNLENNEDLSKIVINNLELEISCNDDYIKNDHNYSLEIINKILYNIEKYNIKSKKIDKEISTIKNKLKEYNKINKNDKKKYSILKHLYCEFDINLININSNNAIIKLIDDEDIIVDLDFDKKNNNINSNSNIKEILIKDITYQTDIHVFDNLLMPLDRDIDLAKNVESYTINFVNKIKKCEEPINTNHQLHIDIKNIINGNIEYNTNISDFLYYKNNNFFRLINVSSGIKSFAIIDLLLKAGIFNDKHILILDEPEVHLHPKWQIEYAKLMVKMAEELDIQILINSHSPYFIEAIQKYSENSEKIADKTNFYLSEKLDDSYAIIKNVNDNIESIYKTLADAYRKLDKDTLWNEVKK